MASTTTDRIFGQSIAILGSVADFLGMVGDGVTDNTNTLNALIANLSSSGGGTIFFTPGKTYYCAGTIVPRSNVTLSARGVYFSSGSGTYGMQSDANGILSKFNIVGAPRFLYGANATAIQLNSAYECNVDVEFYGVSTTAVLLEMTGSAAANPANPTNPNGNHNAAFCFIRTRNAGTCGTHLRLNGYSSTDGIVTDNWFDTSDLGYPNGHYVYGIDCRQWCDSNTWLTKPLMIPLGANAIGLILNSATPTANAGVYGEIFKHGIAIDCFGAPVGDARKGIQVNFSQWDDLGFVEVNPVPPGGIITLNPNVYSIEWTQNTPPTNSTNFLFKNFVGMNVGIGGGQNRAYSLYTTNFNINDGVNQGSIVVADTFGLGNSGTGATGTNVGFATALQITQAAAGTLAHYSINDVALINGATLQFQVGLSITDLTHGANAIYGIKSSISAAGNKYFLFHSGTAKSQLGGPLGINGLPAPNQVTGWGTPTGAGVIANFPGATATLAQCSQVIAQILTDVKNFGLYGV